MSRFTARVWLAMLVFGVVLLACGATAWAQAPTEHEAVRTIDRPLILDAEGAKKLGGAMGAALVVIGGAMGIGRIGATAVESMARQPEVAGQVNVAMIITAAMVEGATLFGVVVALLAVLT